MIFALVGNQNCGKTTLFNALTGANQHVGNFPGITVEQKSGDIRGEKNCTIVDLPGVYSLRTYTQEEIVTRDFILNSHPDAVINIVDVTNPERNLYLTLQLLELHIPTVLALNMMDELWKSGGSVNIKSLSVGLGIPVVPICASKGEGISELINKAIATAKEKKYPQQQDFYPAGAVHCCINAIANLIEDQARQLEISPCFCATKLIEGDIDVIHQLGLNQNELDLLEHSVKEMENNTGLERNEALADMRYNFIENIVSKAIIKPHKSKEQQRSEKIDKLLTGKYTALPIFFGLLFIVFWLTFDVIGGTLSDWMSACIDALTTFADHGLSLYGINPVIHSLIIDGIFAGVGSVLSFLPLIVVLFFFLSLMEDSGYMTRVAFVMDKLLRKIGLSGGSFVPMLIGFGCSVPAIMATRTLSSDRDRKMTILLTPFMSCSAKIPIYAVFCAAFFVRYQALVMIGLYIVGIILAVLLALLLRLTVFRGQPAPFVMELPNYRLPLPKNIFLLLWEKARNFIQRAFTIIFLATIIIWFLQSFDTRLNVVTDSADSMLAMIGHFLAPIFNLAGFGDWRIVTALIAGFTAKEAVVSTLAVLLNTNIAELGKILPYLFTDISAISFLLFTLLYTPCAAAVATIKREIHSHWKTLGIVLMQCCVAWIISTVVYQILRGII